ncbi:MAG: peptidoglycan-binding domain-containing protein [Granulosicoccaceae bacterium]
MNKFFLSTLVAAGSFMLATGSNAQQEDNTQTLPDAKPGECYAKVITPAKFSTRSEELVVQEASERIEIIPAKYESVDQTVVTKESSRVLKVLPAQYGEEFEKYDVRASETNWSIKVGGKRQPASPGMLEGITRSGVELASVKPGTCYREYYTQPEYKTETRRVMVKEGSEKIIISPAQYETAEERVVVKEASSRVADVPAIFRTETESVLVEPARSVWKKGRGPVERINNTTGEIMCLIEVPARYETITKTVLDKAPSSKAIEIPAVYKNVKVKRLVKAAAESREIIPAEFKNITARVKVADAGFFWLRKGEKANSNATYSGREVCLLERSAEFTTIKKLVLERPASTKVTEIPAQYQSVKVQRLVTPASERRISIPARTKTVKRQVQTEPSRLEWRKVLCETNMTPKIVTSIQRALKREGYSPGIIDGVLGQGTLNAVEKYQRKNSLDSGGLTYETLKALKVEG